MRKNIYSFVLSFLSSCALLQGPGGNNGDPVLKYKIAFSSNQSGVYEIYTMNLNGSERIKLTSHSSSDYTIPFYSASGSKINFTYTNNATFYIIYSMNNDGSNLTAITDTSSRRANGVFYSNDSKILYTDSHDGTYQIYTMNADGTNQARVLSAASGVHDLEADISPDESTILYAHTVSLKYNIYTMSISGTNLTALTSSSSYDSRMPRYSPDGSKIVYSNTKDDGSTYEVYIMNSDGSNQTRLTNNSANDSNPCFTPDGKILFQSDRDGHYQIYRMNADGSHQKNLSNNAYTETNPAASKAVF